MDPLQSNWRWPRWQPLAAFLSAWGLLSIVSAVENYVSQAAMGPPVPWSLAFQRALEQWCPWVILSLGVLKLADRVPFRSGQGKRWCAIHGFASAVTAIIHVATYAWLISGQRSILDGSLFTFQKVFQKVLLHQFLFDAAIYWLILLAHQGWHYYQRYRERERHAAALATELVQARLNLLRMQLNPHFLFNTLNTISALIHEHPDTADKVVVRLSELLRRTLDMTETQEVSLEEELRFLERYVDIERARFEERLDFELDLQAGVGRFMVPCLILQPLVENAIRHGIESREESGCVKVTVRHSDNKLALTVSDNGPGLPRGEIKPREGIGLSNTRSRLEHLYGADHQFELINTPGGGLEVRLLIPCRTAPHDGKSGVGIASTRESKMEQSLDRDRTQNS